MIDASVIKKKFKNLNKRILNIKDIDVGILGGIHEKYWVKTNNKEFLFKFNSGDKDYSDYGEVFTSYICYAIGVKCVKAIFSEDFFNSGNKTNYGVFIESYRTKNIKESFSLSSLIDRYKRRHSGGFSVDEVMSIVKEFCLDKNIVLDTNIEQELKEMALLDYLLIQNDRHAKNIEFLIEEYNGYKKLILAPMFDNGFCLYLPNSQKTNIKCLETLLRKKFVELNSSKAEGNPIFYLGKHANFLDDNVDVVNELSKELKNNYKLKKIFENFCKINIDETIDFVASLRKENLPNLNKNLIKYGIQNRVNLLKSELIKIDNTNKLNKENDNALFKL